MRAGIESDCIEKRLVVAIAGRVGERPFGQAHHRGHQDDAKPQEHEQNGEGHHRA